MSALLPSVTAQKRYILRYAPNLSHSHQVAIMGLVQRETGAVEGIMEEIPTGVAIFFDQLDDELVARVYHLVRAAIEQL